MFYLLHNMNSMSVWSFPSIFLCSFELRDSWNLAQLPSNRSNMTHDLFSQDHHEGFKLTLQTRVNILYIHTTSNSLRAASISSCGDPFGCFRLSCICDVWALILFSNCNILWALFNSNKEKTVKTFSY